MSKKMLSIFAAVSLLALPVFASNPESGLKVGEMVSAFHPTHVTGPLKGTSDCPPCTFGARPQVQVWINQDETKNIVMISKLLEKEMEENKASELKAFVIVLTDTPKETAELLSAIGDRIKAKNVALAYLSKKDAAVSDYKVNVANDVKNTVFVYRNKKVSEKFVNLKADEKGLTELSQAIDKITL
ncbi:MAG TPA: hypothetical protein VK934_04855 [Fimbriimonas sp.]|nr:hypothetical protein [Fimbriimonas sp.]